MSKDQYVLGFFSHELPPGLHHKPVADLTTPEDPPPAFYSIQKFNLHSKTDISKTALINAWL